MGLTFPNPVGVAAGLDKNGNYLDIFETMGFGFVELGTVTPLPQNGNPKPRLFRISSFEGLINRMGFNNVGADRVAENILNSKYSGILGINIGKNHTTKIETAHEDYVRCLDRLYDLADYFTVNISSPNTRGLRDLQKNEYLRSFLEKVIRRRNELARKFKKKKPILVKLSPDLNSMELKEVVETVSICKYDGIIATNTTTYRDNELQRHSNGEQKGGLSGGPLMDKSTSALRQIRQILGSNRMTLIGVGGILCGNDAKLKVEAGADLIQIYTGFIYKGPRLIRHILNDID